MRYFALHTVPGSSKGRLRPVLLAELESQTSTRTSPSRVFSVQQSSSRNAGSSSSTASTIAQYSAALAAPLGETVSSKAMKRKSCIEGLGRANGPWKVLPRVRRNRLPFFATTPVPSWHSRDRGRSRRLLATPHRMRALDESGLMPPDCLVDSGLWPFLRRRLTPLPTRTSSACRGTWSVKSLMAIWSCRLGQPRATHWPARSWEAR